ncbi:MAG: hypothetical protein M1821_002583 [Bathelium mastoideum]|nr:MAG: hypothetical protein M1821_002583 [Bathelium mastoideum]
MSGSIQTIPARHGTATYVPQGHSIKIINSSGTQVIDTWVFALNAPPTGRQKKLEKSQEPAQPNEGEQTPKKNEKQVEKENGTVTPASGKETQTIDDEKDLESKREAGDDTVEKRGGDPEDQGATGKGEEGKEETAEETQASNSQSKEENDEHGEQMVDSTTTAASSGRWSAYIPSWSSSSKGAQNKDTPGAAKGKKAPAKLKDQKQPQKKVDGAAQSSTWSSYIPTWSSSKTEKPSNSKGWSTYIPSGQGFSSYLPSQGQLSAFAAQHARNPAKSYAEQLYDFSKTPVGAVGLSAATGSGYASSLYAGYNAYSQHSDTSVPPMEYMSLPHTRTGTEHMRPKVDDVFYSNLREPLVTLTEDTSPGIHDTLIAACDPQRYKSLGVKDWEKHGSCAENLVFALQEFNQKIGLKGSRAVGADVTVNMVPAPLNLFMNIPWDSEGNVKFEATKCKRGDYVRLRAERDVVVVMSSCPQDIVDINGKKPQAGHFIVEDSTGKPVTQQQSSDNKSAQAASPTSPRSQFSGAEESLARLREQRKESPAPAKAPAKLPPKKEDTSEAAQKKERSGSSISGQSPTPAKPTPSRQTSEVSQQAQSRDQSVTPKKKPKKLERRGTPRATD